MRSHAGATAAITRFATCSVQSSWNAPWLRKLARKSLSDLLSTSDAAGT
jgi:hypothetical protein